MLRQGETALATESSYVVKNWTRHRIGVVKPMVYARLIGSEKTFQGKTLPRDIVPTGKPLEFRAIFNDAPLPGADVRRSHARSCTTSASYCWKGHHGPLAAMGWDLSAKHRNVSDKPRV